VGPAHVPNERVSPAQSTTRSRRRSSLGRLPGGGTSPIRRRPHQQSRFYIPNTNPGLIAFLANPVNCPRSARSAPTPQQWVIASQTLWRPEGYAATRLFGDGADHQARGLTAFRIGGSLTGHMWDDIGWRASATYQVNHGEAAPARTSPSPG